MLCKYIGYYKDIVMGLLQNQKFVTRLAKSATLWASTAGRHRSVAAAACLQYMFHKYVSPSTSIKVQHLESETRAESTCAYKCNVCVAPLPQDVCVKLDEVWTMLPFRKDVPEVRVIEL